MSYKRKDLRKVEFRSYGEVCQGYLLDFTTCRESPKALFEREDGLVEMMSYDEIRLLTEVEEP